MVRQLIAEVRERPRDERHAIAVFLSLFVVAILFAMWIITFRFGVDRDNAAQASVQSQPAQAAIESPGAQAAAAAATLREISEATLTSDINAQIPADYITPDTSASEPARDQVPQDIQLIAPAPVTAAEPAQGQSAAADLQSALEF